MGYLYLAATEIKKKRKSKVILQKYGDLLFIFIFMLAYLDSSEAAVRRCSSK